MPPDCLKCEAHAEMLISNKERIKGHDLEFKDLKDALKFKISRWLFIVVLGICAPILGFQIVLLNSIDKKVAVLYDRQEQRAKNGDKSETALSGPAPGKSCLILAENI